MKIRPLHDRIVVKRIDERGTTRPPAGRQRLPDHREDDVLGVLNASNAVKKVG